MNDDPIRSGADASPGTYRCMNCSYRLRLDTNALMPPCPECMNSKWKRERGVETAYVPDVRSA